MTSVKHQVWGRLWAYQGRPEQSHGFQVVNPHRWRRLWRAFEVDVPYVNGGDVYLALTSTGKVLS